MSIEQSINQKLNRLPMLKKVVKRLYQRAMRAVSSNETSEGNIIRVSPRDDNEYFFGYYDKTPEDYSGRYVLCLKVENTWKDVAPSKEAEIVLFDTDNNTSRVVAKTKTWNVQQGCMLQWLGPKYDKNIIYNDFIDEHYVSVILNVFSGEKRIFDKPIYSVSSDGKFALTLDFSRLHRLRPGYGYSNIADTTEGEKIPNGPCVWKLDLETGVSLPIITYWDLYNYETRNEMKDAEHKVNHIMISPNNERFMVLHRWIEGNRKYSRLLTINVDGSDIYNLSDDNMVSHCFWKDAKSIVAFERKYDMGVGYYLMIDKTHDYKKIWTYNNSDGHPSYNSNYDLWVTDTYPNGRRMSSIIVGDELKTKIVGKVFSPFKYDNETRCDLHPRWSRNGDKIYFDSVYEGKRGLYYLKNEFKTKTLIGMGTDDLKKELVSCIIPSYKRSDTVARAIQSALNQSYKLIEVIIVDDNEPDDDYSKKLQGVVESFANDERVRYIQQEKHKNGSAARNVGIRAARGEFVAFLDDDDVWDETKIEKQVEVMKQNTQVGGVTCLWKMYKNNKLIRTCPHYDATNLQFKVFMRQVAVFTSSLILKKEVAIKFGGFDEALLRHQDLQFIIDALSITEFMIVDEYLLELHTDSSINKPDVKRLIKAKKELISSVREEYDKYDNKDKVRIRNAHYYEIAFWALKNKDFGNACKYILKAGININSIKDLIKRYLER